MTSKRDKPSIMDGCVGVAPTAPHTHMMIFLHGRDSTAADFHSDLFETEADGKSLLDMSAHVKWLLPNENILHSAQFNVVYRNGSICGVQSINTSARMNSNKGLTRLSRAFSRSSRMRLPVWGGPQNIILAEIGQGCAVAVHASLKQKSKLGGFIELSSWILVKQSLAKPTDDPEDPQRTPVFLSHSENDEMITIKYGEELRDSLKNVGTEVEWHAYKDGGHWLYEPTGAGDMV